VKRIVIAGGIGAGKTATTDYLASRGYAVVDADVIARLVTEPGRPAWQALRDAFGDAILTSDRTIDRAFLAEVVFNDKAALARLNRITHGAIAEEMHRQLEQASGAAVFIAIPLYRSELRSTLEVHEAWALLVAPETAIVRLREGRAFSEADARARLANQMTNDERAAIVERVIWNEGTVDELHASIERALIESGVECG
jgi:dephospho-CoA kinase